MSGVDWRSVWALTLDHPLFSVALTLIAFQLALALYRRSGWLVLQPVMVGMLLVVGTLYLCGIDYASYRADASMIAVLVGPATVALAVPLYRHIRRIQQLFWPILITLVSGGVLGVALTLAIAGALGAHPDVPIRGPRAVLFRWLRRQWRFPSFPDHPGSGNRARPA